MLPVPGCRWCLWNCAHVQLLISYCGIGPNTKRSHPSERLPSQRLDNNRNMRRISMLFRIGCLFYYLASVSPKYYFKSLCSSMESPMMIYNRKTLQEWIKMTIESRLREDGCSDWDDLKYGENCGAAIESGKEEYKREFYHFNFKTKHKIKPPLSYRLRIKRR